MNFQVITDYDSMLRTAIENAIDTSRFREGTPGYVDEIVSSIKQTMNDNYVVFYQP